MIAVLVDAAKPDGPLAGWLFHGTSTTAAIDIGSDGVRPTAVLQREHGTWSWTEGTYWAIPAVAAFYAEDRCEETDDDPVLVAVRLDDLRSLGDLVIDEQSLDCPIVSRLGKTDEEVEAEWHRLQAEPSILPWQASLAATGSLVCLGEVPADRIVMLQTAEDLQIMLDAVSNHHWSQRVQP